VKVVLVLLIALQLYSATSFITKEEYAANLYYNPRGIGCQMCHGESGEGKKIATYKDQGEKKVFEGTPINKITFAQFYTRVNSKIIGMPRYYLTDTEIQTLFYYLHREEFKHAAKTRKPSH
jgi:hypothetical protein